MDLKTKKACEYFFWDLQKGVKIGSIKSNVGHGEVVSGINSIVKCLLAYEHKQIPPNLHYYDTPHEPIKNGTLRVVDELQPFVSKTLRCIRVFEE